MEMKDAKWIGLPDPDAYDYPTVRLRKVERPPVAFHPGVVSSFTYHHSYEEYRKILVSLCADGTKHFAWEGRDGTIYR